MKYYKRKKRKNKKVYFISLLLIFVFFVSFYLFKTKTSFITYYLSYPYRYIINFKNNNVLSKEIEKLKEENLTLKVIKEKNNTLEEEISYLKSVLSLKNIYTSYNIINATVITRDKDLFYNELTIDKGKEDGIKKDMAVVTDRGLIGKIKCVYDKTSIIELITTNNQISVGVKGVDGYKHGIIKSYDINTNSLIIEGISNYDGVYLNSKVVTTGLGNFPSGLVVGYVKEIKSDSSMISKILYVSLNQDINNIKYVAVLGQQDD